ncbi:PREDICTED: uncharacterized protein LOC104824377 [Tarenaya hassleriana]|uniref:uncharacterized protein LOC104824377 n=1 Tax=Tarenaya hassleriana TaxID=28532 RepID=UPI00053C323C|nr:PREDICTED: uncharacterized protein LOC104824377 [Tarenaya hassleriana]
MGKNTDEERIQQASDAAVAAENNARRSRCSGCCFCGWISRFVSLRCVLVLAFSAAVFLSALFWLPPFLGFRDRKNLDLDLDPRFKDHAIVASFDVEKSVSFLEENMLQLENDIFDEIGIPNTKVVVLGLERFGKNSNRTRVVFGVDPKKKNSKISPEIQSLIRAAFETLVIKDLSFRLTESLFGQPFLFEVLKFPGGITIIPPQPIFPLQKVQIHFNFTLNFSIDQIQSNFYQLTSQLKQGINLSPYENLYVTLSNSRGSTVSPPTTVQSSVLMIFGNNPSRLKQIVQTITSSHSKNLGLNHAVFGKVKQVCLSSILQHSLNDGKGGNAPSLSPNPAPQPSPHHHHNSYLSPHLAPEPSPGNNGFAPASAPTKHSRIPWKSGIAYPPCHFRYWRSNRNISPKLSPHHLVASTPIQSPAPSPAPIHHSIPASSPSPNPVLANTQSPSRNDPETQQPHESPTISPPPSQNSSAHIGQTRKWARLILVLAAVMCL